MQPRTKVAPFTGAWIEIPFLFLLSNQSPVAPFTGAWIEISRKPYGLLKDFESLPSRERGLKLSKAYLCRLLQTSLPSRERGLK